MTPFSEKTHTFIRASPSSKSDSNSLGHGEIANHLPPLYPLQDPRMRILLLREGLLCSKPAFKYKALQQSNERHSYIQAFLCKCFPKGCLHLRFCRQPVRYFGRDLADYTGIIEPYKSANFQMVHPRQQTVRWSVLR